MGKMGVLNSLETKRHKVNKKFVHGILTLFMNLSQASLKHPRMPLPVSNTNPHVALGFKE